MSELRSDAQDLKLRGPVSVVPVAKDWPFSGCSSLPDSALAPKSSTFNP